MPPELISLHIPKAAGTSLRMILEAVYGKRFVFQDYPDRFNNPVAAYNDLSLPRDDIARAVSNYRVVHGHFRAAKYAGIFPQAKRITWLRDPITRLASEYFYMKSVPVDSGLMVNPIGQRIQSGEMSLIEFASLGERSNLYDYYLSGIDIRDFYFVGLFEHFDEDCAFLATMMGWRKVSIPHANRTVSRAYASGGIRMLRDAWQTVSKYHAKDVELYAEAQRLRHTRLRVSASSNTLR